MKGNKQMKVTANISYPVFALFAFACLALAPQARATCQQGCLGDQNTALGDGVLQSNTTGINNTANGFEALQNNTVGQNNTASGQQALFSNTTGTGNVGTGSFTMSGNRTGGFNTAIGYFALFYNTTGNYNTGIGNEALLDNSTGSNNIALGTAAGQNVLGDNNIDVGNSGVRGDSNTIRIGTQGTQTATFIDGIVHSTLAVGVPVIINPAGRLGIGTSSERSKEAIKPMDRASETILALKPVTFRYKQELDPNAIPQFGLVAEQVAKVNPDLVVRDEEGKPYTVRYESCERDVAQ
jgi:hypothetical protein